MPVPSYTVIADSEIDPESPITSSLMFRLRDNVLSLLGVDPATPSPSLAPQGFLRNKQDFTANGSFVVPSGVSVVVIKMTGGGGGGGGGGNYEYNGGSAGDGGNGGGGGASSAIILKVSAGDALAFVIGGGGSGGAAASGNFNNNSGYGGGSGSPTYVVRGVVELIRCNGGGGGGGGTGGFNGANGATGAAGTVVITSPAEIVYGLSLSVPSQGSGGARGFSSSTSGGIWTNATNGNGGGNGSASIYF